MANTSLVSVLMPVYNSEDYINEAVLSILNQTHSHLEFIIVDDGSTDRTVEKIQMLNDARIKLLRNKENLGLAASLNMAIRKASGEYLARMDADDVSHPRRIEEQVKKFSTTPEISLLGTGLRYFGKSKFKDYFPLDHESCKAKLLFNVCFGHPSLMIRAEVFADDSNLYNPQLKQYSEDYDLYTRLIDKYRLGNLNALLLNHRTYERSIKGEAESKRKENSRAVRKRMLLAMGVPEARIDMHIHSLACDFTPLETSEEFYKIGEWFQYLEAVNNETNYFNKISFNSQLTQQFFLIAYHNPGLGIRLAKMNTFRFFKQQCLPFPIKFKYLVKRGIALG
jgi:glycosyltransferase involved in cell wall biosynthesis